MEDTGSSFIITGGISAMETMNLKTREEIYSYVETLFRKMLPYKNRFIFSSSCNTAINTSWDTIKHFRDAWMHYRDMKV
jgi:uroporphyrinogen-III decarboxylase